MISISFGLTPCVSIPALYTSALSPAKYLQIAFCNLAAATVSRAEQ